MMHPKTLLDGVAVTDTQTIADRVNKAIAQAISRGERVDDDMMLALAVELAAANVAQGSGGPFGALLVDWRGDAPKVVGIGANHVTTKDDPSAHAEVEAVRDATTRLGYSDMSGLRLYSSCECCPMCLAVAGGSGVERISYVATRHQAAQAGFSDAVQYGLCELSDERLTTYISEDARDEMLAKLEGHGAVLLDSAGRVLAFGDADTQRDPAALASVQAVRGALALTKGRWLPEGCTLVSYHLPHLAGLMVADWARLLRPRSTANPHLPDQDSATPDAMRICYLLDAPEQMIVRDSKGQDIVAQDATITRQLPCQTETARPMPARRSDNETLRARAQAVFDAWTRGIEGGTQMRY